MRKSIASGIKLGLLMTILLAYSCTTIREMRNDPYYESFYAPASLIMTEEEEKEYRSLPTNEAKKEFIRKFWAVRDWDPSTEENEGKMEFEYRIDYANQWFWGIARSRGTGMPTEAKKGMGWKTERGRIYIILGPPDYYRFNGSSQRETERSSWTRRTGEEVWYYSRHNLHVVFWGDRLMSAGGPLLAAMEDAKLDWIRDEAYRNPKTSLRLMAKFENDALILEIPPTRVQYKEEGDRLVAEFQIKADIYRDGNKIESLNKTATFKYTEMEVMELNSLQVTIPYTPPESGSYKIEIRLVDSMAISRAVFHTSIEFKY